MPTWRFRQVCGVEATCVWVANDNAAHQEYTKPTTFVFIECVIICLYQKGFKILRCRHQECYSLEEHDVVYIPVPNRRNLCFFPRQLRLNKTCLMIPEITYHICWLQRNYELFDKGNISRGSKAEPNLDRPLPHNNGSFHEKAVARLQDFFFDCEEQGKTPLVHYIKKWFDFPLCQIEKVDPPIIEKWLQGGFWGKYLEYSMDFRPSFLRMFPTFME